MAHPKRRHSKQRQAKRRTHQKATVPTSIDLKSGGSQTGVNHRVDPITGFYKGRQIVAIKPKKQKEKTA